MFKRIYIEITNRCNLNCVFCTPDKKIVREMTLGSFKHAFDEVREYTNEICLHILGEPLLHKDFIAICKYINQTNKKLMLSTNGVLISSLYNELLEVKIDTWNISLHASYQLIDEKKDQYFKSILDFISEYQTRYQATFHLRLWADTNKIIANNNEEIRQLLFTKFNYNGVVDRRIRLKERVILSYENEFEWPSLDSNEYSDGYCLGGKTHLGILANGEVVICCLDSDGKSELGNIFTDGFKTILNSEKLQNIIKEFRNNRCYLELCKHCSFKRRNK